MKAAIEWAKGEVFSSRFFLLFGLFFVMASLGFWQLGRSEVARAFVVPTAVAGALLLAVGLGIYFTNAARVASFEKAFNTDPDAFVKTEIVRTEKSMAEYSTIVFKVIPLLIVAAALAIVFVGQPLWRAISITTIGMLFAILLVDINANARIEKYHEQLKAFRNTSS